MTRRVVYLETELRSGWETAVISHTGKRLILSQLYFLCWYKRDSPVSTPLLLPLISESYISAFQCLTVSLQDISRDTNLFDQ
jgi:hypothetical protein